MTSEAYATYDANVGMLTNKGSYIIKYQLTQTCTLINCNQVYFLMKLDWIAKEKRIISMIFQPIMF